MAKHGGPLGTLNIKVNNLLGYPTSLKSFKDKLVGSFGESLIKCKNWKCRFSDQSEIVAKSLFYKWNF